MTRKNGREATRMKAISIISRRVDKSLGMDYSNELLDIIAG